MYGYKCFYKRKTTEVYADSSYQAQVKAAAFFKAKNKGDVDVYLCEKPGPDGKPVQVVHTADF